MIAAAIFVSFRCSWPRDARLLSSRYHDRPVSFAFVANGQASVKSEAVLRIALSFRACSRHGFFTLSAGRSGTQSMIWSRATAIAGSAVVTLASCRIRIVRGHREPPQDCRTMAPGAGWLRAA